MSDYRVFKRPVELIHKENDCGGRITPLYFSTNTNGALVVSGLCLRCTKSVDWEKPLHELVAEYPRYSDAPASSDVGPASAPIPDPMIEQGDREFIDFMVNGLHYNNDFEG